MTTNRPTAFLTLQAFTAASSAALIGMTGFLNTQAGAEEQAKLALEEGQNTLIAAEVAAQVSEITSRQQAELDDAIAAIEEIKKGYVAETQAAKTAVARSSTAAVATPTLTTPPTPPTPEPTKQSPAPAPAPAPAPVDGTSSGS